MLNSLKRWIQLRLGKNASQSNIENDSFVNQAILSETDEEVQTLKNQLVSKDESILEQVQRILSQDEMHLMVNLRTLSNLRHIEIHNVMSVFDSFIQYNIELHLFEGEEKAYVHTITVFEYHDFFSLSNTACRRRANHFDLLKSISSIYAFQIKNDFSLDSSTVTIIQKDYPIDDLIIYKEKSSLF